MRWKLIICAWMGLAFLSPIKIRATENNISHPVSLSSIERRSLEDFFDSYFLHDDFSYTLFGDKPMCLSGFVTEENSLKTLCEPLNTVSSSHLKAYKLLKQKPELAYSQNHAFIFNKFENSNARGYRVYFINKSALLKTIEENIDLFRKELGPNFTTTSFLSDITEEKVPLLELIHYHEGLLGIMLGYGRHNALLFQQKADILGRCWAWDMTSLWGPLKSEADYAEQLRLLDEQLKPFKAWLGETWQDYDLHLNPVCPLGFGCDPNHPETQRLRKQYTTTASTITHAYKQGPFLDVILSALAHKP